MVVGGAVSIYVPPVPWGRGKVYGRLPPAALSHMAERRSLSSSYHAALLGFDLIWFYFILPIARRVTLILSAVLSLVPVSSFHDVV